ncbi:MAG: aminotransferase class I/II-fold pyridoxal phosphate-dependent enzyme [Thermoleophilia bacterium]
MSMPMTFGSDNHAGIVPEVLAAIAEANEGHASGYGADLWTQQAETLLETTFGDAAFALCLTGTGSNVVALSLALRGWESVLAAKGAHIDLDEAGAPEHITGSKIETIATPDGRLTPELLTAALRAREQHHVVQRVVSITQSTECGTAYTPAAVQAIADWAHAHDMLLHVDGARLCNAAATNGCGLGEVAPGADIVSFGLTKNGAMGAEVVAAINPTLRAPIQNARKQATQLQSKMRFVAAQVTALLTDDRWLAHATHANAMALRLADGIRDVAGVSIIHPVEANAVFAVLPAERIVELSEQHHFYIWDTSTNVARLMTAWDTTPADVDVLISAIAN